MATCSIADLIDQACANKFTCLADERIAQAVILQLLCNISEGGGIGGGSQILTYTSGTPANPADTSLPAIAYDPTGALPLLGWNTSTLTWN